MKKGIALVVILCLITVMAVMVADNRLSGSWYVTLDMDVTIESDRQWLDGIELKDVRVPCEMVFSGNHSFTFRLDRDRLPQTITQVREQVGLHLTNAIQDRGIEWLEEQLKSVNLDVDIPAILNDRDISMERMMQVIFQLTGLSFDELLSQSLQDDAVLKILESVEQEGTYRALPVLIFFGSEDKTGLFPMNVLTYSCKDDGLVIKNGWTEYDRLPLEFVR